MTIDSHLDFNNRPSDACTQHAVTRFICQNNKATWAVKSLTQKVLLRIGSRIYKELYWENQLLPFTHLQIQRLGKKPYAPRFPSRA